MPAFAPCASDMIGDISMLTGKVATWASDDTDDSGAPDTSDCSAATRAERGSVAPPPCAAIPATDPTRSAIRSYCGQRPNAARVAKRIAEAAAWGRLNNAVVLAGEFGARDKLNPQARLAWLAAARSGFEAQGIGWALWGYEDSFGLAVPRPPGNEPALNQDVLDALMPKPGP